jgi:hypothetical protein
MNPAIEDIDENGRIGDAFVFAICSPSVVSRNVSDDGATKSDRGAVLRTGEVGLVKPRPICADRAKRRSTAIVFIIFSQSISVELFDYYVLKNNENRCSSSQKRSRKEEGSSSMLKRLVGRQSFFNVF